MIRGAWPERGVSLRVMLAIGVSVVFGELSAQESGATATPAGGGLDVYLAGADPLSGGQSAYISFDFKDKDLHEVLRFISSKVGVNIIADAPITETVTVTFDKVEWRNALDVIATQTNCKVVEVSNRLIRFTQPPTISMEFQDADVKVVLELLAKQAGVNIVMASDIRGKVSLSLRDVPWREALDTLVKTAGYVLVREETSTATEILRVVPPEALRQQQETRHFPLRYVRPQEPYTAIMSEIDTLAVYHGQAGGEDGAAAGGAMVFHLETALRQVVSQEGGQLTYDPGTNTFIVKDIKPKLDEIANIISLVDVPPPQVYVEVKFVRTTNTDIYERGIKLDDPTTPERDGFQASVRMATPGEFDDAVVNGNALFDDPLNVFAGTFPFDIGRRDGNALGVTGFQALGILDLTQTQAFLKLVKDDERSRIVQEPTLTMVNNRPAVIFVGETVPYAVQRIQQDQNGNITVAIEENENSPINVGFTLYLTPHVVPGTDQIDLSVIPRVATLSGTTSTIEGFDRFSFSAPGSATETFIDLPRTSSQTVVTYMRVQDGQTAVIGGLQTERRVEIETKVPLLSSIPILGNLFTWKRKQSDVESLMILITPRILKNVTQERAVFDAAIQKHKKADYFYDKYEKPFEEENGAESGDSDGAASRKHQKSDPSDARPFAAENGGKAE